MQNAVITGVSSGVGAATAKIFAQQGYQVYGLARHASAQQQLVELGVKLFDVDLADENSVEKAVAQIVHEAGTVDVLINVAGLAINGPIELMTIEDAKRVFAVNVFGTMQLTQLLIPVMRHQNAGRIINISSILGEAYQPLMGWYAGSKHALEAVTDALRLEVQTFGIAVSLIQLSGVATPMATGESDFVKTTRKTVYEPRAKLMTQAFIKGWKYNLQPAAVAQFILKVAQTSKPRPRYARGSGAKALIVSHRILPTHFFDKLTLGMLKVMGK